MKKPNIETIRTAPPLARSLAPGDDRLGKCNVCGKPATDFTAHRACDVRDEPFEGPKALVFIGRGADHVNCRAELEAHPRLFIESNGAPGHLPRLCSRCTHRNGLACGHPSLKANGGPGLKIGFDHMAMVICVKTSHGSGRPLSQALDCEGQTLPGEEPTC